MVSIRRQRLIKLYGRSPPLDFIPSFENGQPPSWAHKTRHVSVPPTPSVDISRSAEQEKTKSEEPESSNVNESSSSNKQPIQHPAISVFKRRKRHRRKHFENQEPCLMRGVYYKNMKWQAAIKVDKKQIHLGTVGSQQEAACLYDRAAFMCGREPNFELTVKEKDELSKLSWDDFLTMTRSAINSKKHQRRVSSRMKFEQLSQNNGDPKMKVDQGGKNSSGSEDAEMSGSL
ncbi:ethylene-responsive transcription factor-like protein At4g13040 isoform X1 [Bidens hawaiensis]|uniref:ethylene-responsive transcription factor-like protein At4g13040 isoform X1 n=1 Tax=Bidens hawaiensis TaxID=980011 RepID=UPI004049B117